MSISKCPLCGEKIKVGNQPWLGQEFECPACEAILEVVTLDPVSLDSPYDDDGYLEANYDEDFEIKDY